MKQNMKILALLLTLLLLGVMFPKQASAQQSYVSLQVFYDQLSPYGQWVDYPNYGYVWIPSAGYDFVPYSTNGQWILTEYGWTWYSNYDWGWAAFHYGRWDYDNYYGWFWIPDNEWGPSWVIWSRANGYYGWAPMRPGININISFGNNYNPYNDRWVFVSERNFGRSNIQRYQVNEKDHDWLIRSSRVINRTYDDRIRNRKYISGPDRGEVQNATGRTIRTYGVQDNYEPGHKIENGQLRIYRPQINKHNDREQKAIPSRISNLNDVKRPTERNQNNRQQNVNQIENNKRQQQLNKVNSSGKKRNEQTKNEGEVKSKKHKKRND